MKLTHAAIATALAAALSASASSEYDTLWMTVWDHEADGYDFQKGGRGCASASPAKDLPADRKPVSTSNENFRKFFSTEMASAKYCVPLVMQRVEGDSSMYYYDNQMLFFPIDSVDGVPVGSRTCCGADKQEHNFYFCDETHGTFRYRGGEVFRFTGDDDFLLYINNKLVISLPNCHAALSDSVVLDEIASTVGLRVGNYYNFDMFHCDRSVWASTFSVEMSIDVIPPAAPGYHIADVNRSLIPEGDTVTIHQGDGPRTLMAMELSDTTQLVDCESVVLRVLTAVAAEWRMDGSPLAGDSIVSIDPSAHSGGAMHVLTMHQGETVRRLYVKIVGSQTLSPPTASPAGGEQLCRFEPVSVVLSHPVAEARIYYTTDMEMFSRDAWTLYTGPVAIDSPATLRAIAVGPPDSRLYDSSTVVSFSYTDSATAIPAPVATPGGGDLRPATAVDVALALGEAPAGTVVYYTLDGSDPDPRINPAASAYTAVTPIKLQSPGTTELRAVARFHDCVGEELRHSYTLSPVATPVSAWYRDADADGRIETAEIRFGSVPAAKPADLTLVDPVAGTRHAIPADLITLYRTAAGAADSMAITVTLTNAFAFGTGFDAGPLGNLGGASPYAKGDFKVHDSAAPVLVSASYRPGGGEGRDRAVDTLVVRASEPAYMVQTGEVYPFRLRGTNGEYTFRLELLAGEGTTELTFAVAEIEGADYPRNGDSIWIAVGQAGDGAGGTVQNNPDNRRVPMTVKYPQVSLRAQTAPNPFTPGPLGTAIPSVIFEKIQTDPDYPPELKAVRHGTVVRIAPSLVLPDEVFSSAGTGSVYDAVGNLLVADQPLARDSDGDLYFVWDGRNGLGRFVGSGTYLAVIVTNDPVNGSRIHRQMLGVKR